MQHRPPAQPRHPATRATRAVIALATAVALATGASAWADNTGDWYDNRDDGHATVRLESHPGAQAMSSGFGAQSGVIEDRVVVGNASLAFSGSFWGSLVRISLMHGGGSTGTYAQYTSNNAYWYPEHRDHDAKDHFHAMTPAVNVSQGSSGSEVDEVHKWLYTLAAFPADTKARLVEMGLLMPTVQMIARRTRVESDAEYLSGVAHPSAFDNADNRAAMEAMAAAMEVDDLPPVVRLRVLEDSFDGELGVDFFEAFGSEAHYTQPVSICRIFRGREYTKRMVVTAADSEDPDGRPLAFHWRVLRGDGSRVRIAPRGESGEEAEIEIDYHPETTIPGSSRRTNLVVVGAFVHDGTHYSAPAFVTSFSLANETREYDPATGRLLRASYSGAYVYPFLSAEKSWQSDTFVYADDDDGRLLGWVRDDGVETREFVAAGHVVTAGSLAAGVTGADEVAYRFDPETRQVHWESVGPIEPPCDEDVTPPSITCPGLEVAFVDAACEATMPDLLSLAMATDDCTAPADLAMAQSPAPGTPLPPGVHRVTLTVTDRAGHNSSCEVDWTLEDRAFLRGNINRRAAHSLDLADVVDLVHVLFAGRTLTFDCEAALDVNNDGAHDILDVIGLVYGVFRPQVFEIPPPTGVPGVGEPDGGSISSALGCEDGEYCP